MDGPMSEPLAIYVHTPFCPSKCGYCDFNSYAMSGEIMPRTAAAIAAEVRRSKWAGRPAKTIFFGGGTPTFLATEDLLSILAAVIETHPPIDGCEVTSEANPGTADAEKFAAMRRAGFNRISLGAQSFVDSELVQLERVHTAAEIDRAVHVARKAGFENLNLDLMFALPRQTMKVWLGNLERALQLGPEHLSLYCLTIEPETSFYRKQLRGQLDLPDDEAQVAMYDSCVGRVLEEGYRQYEISNFAKPGLECRHNLGYWRCEDYAGYGPGAVGCVDGVRSTNWKHPERYCDAVEQSADVAFDREILSADAQRLERVMLGLRLNDGLDRSVLDPTAVKRLVQKGWLEESDEVVALTPLGRHYCSEAVLELV